MAMEKQMEVEYIGNLDKNQFEELKKKLETEGAFKKRKERISFMYFKDNIPKDISEIKDEDIDLRLRITNKKPEIIVKKGSFTGAHSRKEISIVFSMEEIETYIDFLSALGWHIGVIYAAETFVYEYQGIEFSLVAIKDYGYNFEAEILTTKEDEPNARKKIGSVLKELNLMPFDEDGLNKQCNEINNQKELRFDFSRQNFDEFRTKFSDFF